MHALPHHRPAPLARLILAAICAWATAAGAADSLAGPSGHEGDAKVLPVLNAQSGRVEALLLLEPDGSGMAPLDRMFPGSSVLPGLGVRIGTPDGGRLHASLQPDHNAGLALLCNQGVQVAATLGPLSQQCLLARIGAPDDPLAGAVPRPGLALDAGWRSPGGAMDMSFGLSWLDGPLRGAAGSLLPAPGELAQPLSPLPPLAPLTLGDLRMKSAYWTGRFDLGSQSAIHAGASLGSQEMNLLFGGPLRWDTTTVTFGVDFRGLSGRLTGRLIELPQGQGSFRGLDLGFSWRTPWQGELSFGARNLLDQTPDTSKWPLSELPALEAPGGRTPYVRYKQDL